MDGNTLGSRKWMRHRVLAVAIVGVLAVLATNAREILLLWDAPAVGSRIRDGLETSLDELRTRTEVSGDFEMFSRGESQGLALRPGQSGTFVYPVEKKPGQSVIAVLWFHAPPDLFDSRIEASADGTTFVTLREGVNADELPLALGEFGKDQSKVWIRMSAAFRPDVEHEPVTVVEHLEFIALDHEATSPDLPNLFLLVLLPVALFVLAEAAGLSSGVASALSVSVLVAELAIFAWQPSLITGEWGYHRFRWNVLLVLNAAVLGAAGVLAWYRRAWTAHERRLEGVTLAWILSFAFLIRWRLLQGMVHLRLDPDAETVFTNTVSMPSLYSTGSREPLWPWMTKLFQLVFGPNELSLRYFSLTFSIVVLYMAYRFVRDYTGRRALALLVPFILTFHGLFIGGSPRGLRTELLTFCFLFLSYFVFVSDIPLKKRLPGLTLACTITTLTALSTLSAQGLLLAYALWRHKLPLRALLVPVTVAALAVTPHLLANHRATGDPFHTVNMYGVWWRNYEFVMIDGTGCEGCPTREEFQKDSMTGTKVTLTGYIFGMHSLPEVVRRVAGGYWELFLGGGQLFGHYVGAANIRPLHFLYFVGLVLLAASRWRELLLIPLLSLNLVAFTIRLGIDARLITHLVPIGSLAVAMPLWLAMVETRKRLDRATGREPDLPVVPGPDGKPVQAPARFTKADRTAWYDAGGELRERFKKINRYYHSELERFFGFVVPPGARVLEIGCSTGDLLAAVKPAHGVGIDISGKTLDIARAKYPHLTFIQADIESLPADFVRTAGGPFEYVILSDTIGELDDILAAFESIATLCTPTTRLVISYYNYLWEPVLKIGERTGSKMPQRLQSWLSAADIEGFLMLAGFETVRRGSRTLLPRRVPVLAWLANRLLAQLPGLRSLSLVEYLIARPSATLGVRNTEPSVTVLVPTRNELGNIEGAVARIPSLGRHTEILFVDGSSTDGTVEKIEELAKKYEGVKDIKLLHQVPRRASEQEAVRDGLISAPGKMLKLGKGDAVRKGFDAATGEIVLILDADLTVPPEDLPKFVKALVDNRGEFVNGTRLVYPMEKQAMRFLNLLANKGFSILFTWLLEQRIKDTLCGTKALWKKDYQRIKAGRMVFGDFDPFGDFDLLFGAAKLGLKIVEIPIRYRERIHGDVKIERFKHGVLLLKMCGVAFRRLKMV